MKKRNFFALFLTFSILLCQTVFVLPVRADTVVMEENFNTKKETDAVKAGGYIASVATGSKTGTKVEYASVGKDNMALKLTVPKDETSGVGVSLYWTKIESGVVSVSFDFWSDNHSGCIERLRVADRDGREITGGRSAADGFADRTDGTNKLVDTIGSTPIRIEYVLTCSASGVNSYDVYVNGDPKYTEQTPANTTRTNVGRLAFGVKGTIAGVTSGSAEGDGIYYLDNVVVKKVEKTAAISETVPVNGGSAAEGSRTASVSFSAPIINAGAVTVIKNGTALTSDDFSATVDAADSKKLNLSFTDPFMNDDRFRITVDKNAAGLAEDYSFEFVVVPQGAVFEGFEGYAVGAVPSKLADKNSGCSEGDGTARVENNPDGAHRAVKIVAKNAKDKVDTGFVSALGRWTTGIAEVSYDLRIDNHSATLQQYFGDSLGNGTNVPSIYQNGDSFYLENANGQQLFTLADVTGKAARIRFVVDMEAKEYRVFINGVQKASHVYSRADIGRFTFRTRNTAQQATNTNGSATGDGVYWMDNFYYRHYEKPFAVESSTISEGCVLDMLDTPIQITLTKAVNPETVTAENIVLYKDDVRVDAAAYTLSCSANNRVITIATNEGLDYNASYRIVIGTGVCSAQAESLADAWEVSFTTGEESIAAFRMEAFAGENPVGNLNEVKGQTITLRISLNQELATKDYVFIGSCKSEEGMLQSVAVSAKSGVGAGSFDVLLTIPDDIDASSYLSGYLWTSTTELIPLAPPVSLLKNE